MTTERIEAVEKLSALSVAVAAEHAEHEAAREELVTAEAALLDRIVATVKPTLPALCSKLVSRDRLYWIGSVRTERETEYHDERGLIVAGGRRSKHHDQNRGAYVGQALVVMRSGAWGSLAYSGSWSRWQGESNVEETTLTAVADSRAVASEWDVDEIIATLEAVLQGQTSGAKAKRTEEIRRRLGAIGALVKLA